MTDAPNPVCSRCGFTNVPGDQFCGSCGAFLEWVAAPAADEAPTTVLDLPGAAAPVPPPAGPAPAPTTWAPAPAPMPEESPSAGARLDLVRCPACGIANPAGRTFCQSCGATLSTAARIAPASPDAIAAAVARTSARSTAPVAAGAPRASAPRAGVPARRGIPGWVPIIGAAGILVGVVVVVGALLLAGKPPATGATAAPSIPGGSVGPLESGGSGGPSGGPSGPPELVPIALTGAKASSVVGNRDKFQPQKAIDGDAATAWQEGKSKEKGQWIEVTFEASRVDRLVILNGYQASTPAYYGNRRLRDITVAIDGGEPIAVRLKDTTKAQAIDLGGVSGATTIRITIVSTYNAKKTTLAGSPFDDAAVSEITVFGVPGG